MAQITDRFHIDMQSLLAMCQGPDSHAMESALQELKAAVDSFSAELADRIERTRIKV